MKIKNMKSRSSRIREIDNNQASISAMRTTLSSSSTTPDSRRCYYYDCEEGPDLRVMTEDQRPIDSAIFTKISNDQCKIEYKFNSKINDSFKIFGPFPSSSKISESDINNYIELRKRGEYDTDDSICRCNNSFSLRNKLLSGEIYEGFMGDYYIFYYNGSVIGTQSQIVLPASFIVFNQQGLYFYLNVDQNSNVTFTPT